MWDKWLKCFSDQNILTNNCQNVSAKKKQLSSETIAKQLEAIQLQFDQSYDIKGTQNFHYFHPIHAKQIRMKGIGLVSTYSLVVQTSSN